MSARCSRSDRWRPEAEEFAGYLAWRGPEASSATATVLASADNPVPMMRRRITRRPVPLSHFLINEVMGVMMALAILCALAADFPLPPPLLIAFDKRKERRRSWNRVDRGFGSGASQRARAEFDQVWT
jgi:hypothetical protein